jgi:hypothetical protein
MTKPKDTAEDFDAFDCSSSSIDVLIIDGPEHVGRAGSVRMVNGEPFDVKFFGKRLIKVDFSDGTAFMAEPEHLRNRCENCSGTGRAWKICEFTNDPIMADCEGCDGGRLFD